MTSATRLLPPGRIVGLAAVWNVPYQARSVVDRARGSPTAAGVDGECVCYSRVKTSIAMNVRLSVSCHVVVVVVAPASLSCVLPVRLRLAQHLVDVLVDPRRARLEPRVGVQPIQRLPRLPLRPACEPHPRETVHLSSPSLATHTFIKSWPAKNFLSVSSTSSSNTSSLSSTFSSSACTPAPPRPVPASLPGPSGPAPANGFAVVARL